MEGTFVMRMIPGTGSTRRGKTRSLPGLIALAAGFAVGALDSSRVWAANGVNGPPGANASDTINNPAFATADNGVNGGNGTVPAGNGGSGGAGGNADAGINIGTLL